MDTNSFLKNFKTLTNAPNGIQHLRELILQLPVQGKLVPQDANDEPASELLKKIQAEKEKLVSEGTIKRQAPLPQIRDDEKPFEIPKNWVWVRLGQVYITNGQKKPNDDFSYIDVASIDNNVGNVSST